MKKIKKILALVIVMIMIVSMIPMTSAGALSYPEISLNTTVEVQCDMNIHSYTFTPEEDGWYKFVSSGEADTYITLYDSFFREVGFSDDGDDQNFELVAELTAGELYYIDTATWEEESGTFSFGAKKAVVATSLEVISMPYDTTVIKGLEYDTAKLDGLEIEFTLSDGSKAKWDITSDEKIGDSYVSMSFGFDEDVEFYIEVFTGSAYLKIPYTAAESNIESIEYSSGEDLVYYENSNGFYDESLECYIYYSYVPDDAVITVNYKDGTSQQGSFYEYLNDIEFFMEDTQYAQPWVVGGENYIYITYLDARTAVPVTILPCPIADIIVDSSPEKVYYYGDENNGFIDSHGMYSFYPYDLSGLSFTVEYKDGTRETYTDKDIDEYNSLIDGYTYEISEVQCESAGTYSTTLSYKGFNFDFDVIVAETTVESIEFVKDADRTQYENYYYPVLDGMQIKVNFKDGTSKTFEVTPDNTSYVHEGDIGYIIDADGEEIRVRYEMDDDLKECYSFNILGCTEYYYGFEFVETRALEDVQFENVSKNGDSMVATVTYEDGSVDTLNFDLLAYEHFDTYYDAFAMTENGCTYYSIEKSYRDDGSAYYYIFLLGEYFEVDCPENNTLGDVDGNGEINVIDATAIQLHISKFKVIDGASFERADVNSDGKLDIIDATAIQRYVAKIITEF